MKLTNRLYFQLIFDQGPRLLGSLDRRPNSTTFGCFDREFWHYSTADFSCARKQEGCLSLALLYRLKQPRNYFFKDPALLAWINASLIFWTKIQSANGSFSEWYPRENSFVATAFSSYAVSETLLLLEKIDNAKEITQKLEKAVDFLRSQVQLGPQNQQTALPVLFYNLYLLTQKKEYRQMAKEQIKTLSGMQTKEGWFSEYGGVDFGYLSVSLDYLTKYFRFSSDQGAAKIIGKIIDFFAEAIDEGFFSAQEVGSRNTAYLIPQGFEFMAKEGNKKAKEIAFLIRQKLANKETVGPDFLDDRYLLYNGYTYLQAYENSLKTIPFADDKKERENSFKYFPEAGLIKIRKKSFWLTINGKKGGVCQLYFPKNKKLVTVPGPVIRQGKKILIAAKQNQKTKIKISSPLSRETTIKITGNFFPIKEQRLDGLKFLALRIYQYLLGGNALVSRYTKDLLRNFLIQKNKPARVVFARKITVDPQKISLADKVKNLKSGKEFSLAREPVLDIYVPSSRYFCRPELSRTAKRKTDRKDTEIKTVWDINGEEKVLN